MVPTTGLYRAKVINDRDPERTGRLRLQIPDVLGEGVTDWCPPCIPHYWFRLVRAHSLDPSEVVEEAVPKPGDAVWAMFEAGDPDRPVWIGTWRMSQGEDASNDHISALIRVGPSTAIFDENYDPSEKLTEDDVGPEGQTVIDGGRITTGMIESAIGAWSIDLEGTVDFTGGTIGGITIAEDYIGTSLTSGNGWRIYDDGSATFRNATIRGSLNADDLDAGTITGITLQTGTSGDYVAVQSTRYAIYVDSELHATIRGHSDGILVNGNLHVNPNMQFRIGSFADPVTLVAVGSIHSNVGISSLSVGNSVLNRDQADGRYARLSENNTHTRNITVQNTLSDGHIKARGSGESDFVAIGSDFRGDGLRMGRVSGYTLRLGGEMRVLSGAGSEDYGTLLYGGGGGGNCALSTKTDVRSMEDTDACTVLTNARVVRAKRKASTAPEKDKPTKETEDFPSVIADDLPKEVQIYDSETGELWGYDQASLDGYVVKAIQEIVAQLDALKEEKNDSTA